MGPEIGKGTSSTRAVGQPKRMRLSAAEVRCFCMEAAAAESGEMTLPAVMKARQPPRHEDNLVLFAGLSL